MTLWPESPKARGTEIEDPTKTCLPVSTYSTLEPDGYGKARVI
jgi:hypothetical protein